MLGRLLIGIVKGLIVGALLGFGLAQLGMATPPVVIAYVAAALTGVLVGLVAGKPIWAKDARIEAGMKAFAGALLGSALMYAARRWLTMEVPTQLTALVKVHEDHVAFGQLALTSLPAVAALLGGFYEVDNTPEDAAPPGASSTEGKDRQRPGANKRVAPNLDDLDLDDESDAEAERKRAKK